MKNLLKFGLCSLILLPCSAVATQNSNGVSGVSCTERKSYQEKDTERTIDVCLDSQGKALGVYLKSDETNNEYAWLSAEDIAEFGYCLTPEGLCSSSNSFQFESFQSKRDGMGIYHINKAYLYHQTLLEKRRSPSGLNISGKCVKTVEYLHNTDRLQDQDTIFPVIVCLNEQNIPMGVSIKSELTQGQWRWLSERDLASYGLYAGSRALIGAKREVSAFSGSMFLVDISGNKKISDIFAKELANKTQVLFAKRQAKGLDAHPKPVECARKLSYSYDKNRDNILIILCLNDAGIVLGVSEKDGDANAWDWMTQSELIARGYVVVPNALISDSEVDSIFDEHRTSYGGHGQVTLQELFSQRAGEKLRKQNCDKEKFNQTSAMKELNGNN